MKVIEAPQAPFTIVDLSPEIHEKIFGYLNRSDWQNLRATSKLVRDTVDGLAESALERLSTNTIPGLIDFQAEMIDVMLQLKVFAPHRLFVKFAEQLQNKYDVFLELPVGWTLQRLQEEAQQAQDKAVVLFGEFLSDKFNWIPQKTDANEIRAWLKENRSALESIKEFACGTVGFRRENPNKRWKIIPSELLYLKNLNDLDINRQQIHDISIVSKFKNLHRFFAFGNLVADLSPISNLPLQEIRVENFKKSEDIDCLFTIRSLKKVWIEGVLLKSLASFHGLNELTALSLNNCEINEDVLIGLQGMESLKTLHLEKNKIKRIPNLNLKNLETLNISHNQLQTMDGFNQFPALKELEIHGNRITTLSGYRPHGKVDVYMSEMDSLFSNNEVIDTNIVLINE